MRGGRGRCKGAGGDGGKGGQRSLEMEEKDQSKVECGNATLTCSLETGKPISYVNEPAR